MNDSTLYSILKELEISQIVRKRAGSFELKHDSLAKMIVQRRTAFQQRLNDVYSFVKSNRKEGELSRNQLEMLLPLRSKLKVKYENEQIAKECEEFIDMCIEKEALKEQERLNIVERERLLRREAEKAANDAGIAAANAEAATAEARTVNIKLIRQKKIGSVFLGTAISLLICTIIIMAWTYDILNSHQRYINRTSIIAINEYYQAGDHYKLKQRLEQLLKTKRQGRMLNFLLRKPLKELEMQIDSFTDKNFLFDSLLVLTKEIKSPNGKFLFEPKSIGSLNSTFNLTNANGEILFSDSIYIPTGFFSKSSKRFAYLKKNNIHIIDLATLNTLDSIGIVPDNSNSSVKYLDLTFDDSDSYLYVDTTSHGTNRQLTIYDIRSNIPQKIYNEKFSIDSNYNTFKDIIIKSQAKIVHYKSSDKILIQDFAKNATITLPFKKICYVYPLLKHNILIVHNDVDSMHIIDLSSNRVIKRYGNIYSSAYRNLKLIDSTGFPIYIADKFNHPHTYLLNTFSNNIIDSVTGIAESLILSPSSNNWIYYNKSDVYIKKAGKKEIRLETYGAEIKTYNFVNDIPYFLVGLNNENILLFKDPITGKVRGKQVPSNQIQGYLSQKGNDLFIRNIPYGFEGIIHLDSLPGNKKYKEVTFKPTSNGVVAIFQ
jgi:hypothetical protein